MSARTCLAVSASARGAAHIRRAAPNQDFSGWEDFGDGVFALAVSDGHGAPLHARSADGARFAVEACLAEMRAAWRARPAALRTGPEASAREIFAQALQLWRDKVEAAIAVSPLDQALEAQSHAAGFGPFGPYGATLIAVLAWPDGGLALQLGDGDLMIRDAAGGAILRPIAADAREGEETASLCEAQPLEAARFAALGPWQAICLTSDGFAKSFTDATAAEGAALALLARIAGGLPVPALEADLATLSAQGSGDDISLAAVVRAAVPASPALGHKTGPIEHIPRAWLVVIIALLAAALVGQYALRPKPPAPGTASAPGAVEHDPSTPGKKSPAPSQAPKSKLGSAAKSGGNDGGQSGPRPK